ncbi:PucR family transcriptional regulator [Alkalicoccobacillus murimartini]|uniref:DNA-binding PucR family transcriptional regulator n=1 Tax=Alkalicoccobacillus murimartini TaxID=171685 RepID=A0ABT9YHW5_9BACI|nr:helix-turn-helix domain-containing protein [Alkalicoccobacillus murimartini]MDQ0207106.1 DNA-binding PucR family transcriptional regulator [Alkalicoccobacillus murimartini]
MGEPLKKLESLSEIGEIIDYASKQLKRPVILERADFSLAAYHSYHINQFDLANQQTIFSKKCPQHIYDKFLDCGIIDTLQESEERFTVGPIEEIGLNARIVKTIRYKGEIQGYMWLQEHQQSLTEWEVQFFEATVHHLAETIHSSQVVKLAKSDSADRVYQAALSHSYSSKTKLQEIAHEEGIPYTRQLAVTVFSQPKGVRLSKRVDVVRKIGLPNSYVLTYQGQIIVLTGEYPTPFTIRSMLKALKEEVSDLEYEQMWMGISHSCLNLSELARGYQEAAEVIQIAEMLGDQPIDRREYATLGMFRYLETVSQVQEENGYQNPDLLILERKDAASHTEFIKTIEFYLLNNCRVKAASEQLFIHPNTLSYRLKQIQELTAIRFDNFNLKCQLLIDIMVLKKLRRDQKKLS